MPRELTESEVEFTLECLSEHTPIEGNALASGDDEQDRAAEQWIIDQLNDGNQWAWCCVRVVARWKGFEDLLPLEGDDYLGCCSYESEAAFREPGGYFDDMKAIALERLNAAIAEAAEAIAAL